MRIKEGNKEQAILDAAIEVFAQDGYFDSKIHRIADRAGVATGTVYLYFQNKERILLKILDSVWSELFEHLKTVQKRTDIDPTSKLTSSIDAIFDYFLSNPPLVFVFVNEHLHLVRSNQDFTIYYRKTLKLIETLLQEGITGGQFRSSINVKIFSSFYFGGLRFLLHEWAQNGKSLHFDEIRSNAKSLIINGLLLSGGELKE